MIEETAVITKAKNFMPIFDVTEKENEQMSESIPHAEKVGLGFFPPLSRKTEIRIKAVQNTTVYPTDRASQKIADTPKIEMMHKSAATIISDGFLENNGLTV